MHELTISNFLFICPLIFCVAFLYSSVGHGGASGYLAILSFFGFPHNEMATTALILNILVASLAFYSYWKAGYFSWSKTWPFIVASIPAAYLGGLVKIPEQTYNHLLGFALIYAAYRLIRDLNQTAPTINSSAIPLRFSLPAGAGIGFLSGVLGIGGGIFLSPIIILCRWGNPKETSATAAFFIIVNALSGLIGRINQGNLVIGHLYPFLLSALLGGLLGAYIGANRFSGEFLRRMLAFVLLMASLKLLLP